MTVNGASAPTPRGLDYDLIERAAIVLVFAIFAYRTITVTMETGAYLNLVLLTSEATIAVFAVLRRRGAMSMRFGDWVAGFAATLAPLLVIPVDNTHAVAPVAVCAALMLSGFILQMAAKLTLRRSFGIVAANRGVKIGGPYRLIRHPMYAGYVLTHIGFLLGGPSLWNFSLYAFALGLQIVRIRAEERILGEDPSYQEFSKAVPYRLVPLVY